MAGTYRSYKLSYGATEETIIVSTDNVDRLPEETTVIRQTPNGSRYKQVFGSGKLSWGFNFFLSDRDIYDFFKDAYDSQVAGDTITFSEENDAGGFTAYTVIINLPRKSADTVGDSPIDRSLSVEVLEA